MALLPTHIAKRPVVPGVLGNVADLVDRVVMQEHLDDTGRASESGRCTPTSRLPLLASFETCCSLIRFFPITAAQVVARKKVGQMLHVAVYKPNAMKQTDAR